MRYPGLGHVSLTTCTVADCISRLCGWDDLAQGLCFPRYCSWVSVIAWGGVSPGLTSLLLGILVGTVGHSATCATTHGISGIVDVALQQEPGKHFFAGSSTAAPLLTVVSPEIDGR